MRNFTEVNLTDAVLAKLEGATDPRLKQIMTSLIKHLHAFVREVELTESEWFAGIQFLTATGQKCDDKRQEYILLSDTLGVSMLVDAINHRKPTGATESTVLGPFYVPAHRSCPPVRTLPKEWRANPPISRGACSRPEASRSPVRPSTCGPPTARAGTTCNCREEACARAERSGPMRRGATHSGP